MNWSQWFRLAKEALAADYDADEATAVLQRLIEARGGLRRIDLAVRGHESIPEQVREQLAVDLQRLRTGEPVQYVLGHAPFLGMDLFVTSDVLIPRTETEELVLHALDTARSMPATDPARALRLLDIGTGSGCIAIALARALPGADITAVDRSPAALSVAEKNGATQGVRIRFREADVLDAHVDPGAPFDLIVSNPPYIPDTAATGLHRRVREHEPPLALFSPGDDPLLFYRVIAQRASTWLVPGGWLLCEIHAGTGEQTEALFRAAGLRNIRVLNDLAGNERIVLGQQPEPGGRSGEITQL